MNELQFWIQLQREIIQTQQDWVRHDQRIKSEERFKRTFGYPGEHPNEQKYRRIKRNEST